MNIKDRLNKFVKNIADTFRSNENKIMKAVGESTSDVIYKRVKAGYGVDNGSKQKIAALSKSYVKKRTRTPPTGSLSSVKRSNLTNTGQMLDAIRYKRYGDDHVVEVAKTGRDDGKRNSDIARYVSYKNTRTGAPARPFMGLTDGEKRIVLRDFQKQIKMLVKQIKSKGR